MYEYHMCISTHDIIRSPKNCTHPIWAPQNEQISCSTRISTGTLYTDLWIQFSRCCHQVESAGLRATDGLGSWGPGDFQFDLDI